MRVMLDFDFNVYFYLMLTFAVLLLFVIMCQLATTHSRLTQIRDLLEQRIPNPKARKPKADAEATEAETDNTKEPAEETFYRGQIVLLLKDESQMKIAEDLGDGTYVCRKNGVKAGVFRKDEITDFSAYWHRKNAQNQ